MQINSLRQDIETRRQPRRQGAEQSGRQPAGARAWDVGDLAPGRLFEHTGPRFESGRKL